MSITAMNWALDLDLPGHLKLTLVTLVSYANEKSGANTACVAAVELARKLRCHERHVRRHLHQLEQLGVISHDGYGGFTGRIKRYRWPIGVEILIRKQVLQASRKGVANADTESRIKSGHSEPHYPESNPDTESHECGSGEPAIRTLRAADTSISSLQEKSGVSKPSKARPQDLMEVVHFFESIGGDVDEAESFYFSKESNGWKQGKGGNPIKCWKSAARYWHKQEPQYRRGATKKTSLQLMEEEYRKL